MTNATSGRTLSLRLVLDPAVVTAVTAHLATFGGHAHWMVRAVEKLRANFDKPRLRELATA